MSCRNSWVWHDRSSKSLVRRLSGGGALKMDYRKLSSFPAKKEGIWNVCIRIYIYTHIIVIIIYIFIIFIYHSYHSYTFIIYIYIYTLFPYSVSHCSVEKNTDDWGIHMMFTHDFHHDSGIPPAETTHHPAEPPF